MARNVTLFTILCSLGLAACNRPAEVHYRVTVEVNDRGTIRSGSSVWAFALSKSALPLASPYNPHFRGEAVAVDLPGRGTLFALVQGETVKTYPENLFGNLQRSQADQSLSSDRIEDLRRIKAMLGSSEELVCTDPPWIGLSCPMLVRFRDSRAPETVEKVDPADLVASFGPDVKLQRVTVKITDDPVTVGIQKKLPWLQNLHGSYINGASTRRNAPLGLQQGDFTTEDL